MLKAWQIWVDTGGTFTDCLALPPDSDFSSDRLLRGKVLSSGAFRGTIVQRISDHELLIQQSWGVCDDFIRGFDFHLPGSETIKLCVNGFDSARSIITFDSVMPASVEVGAMFEVRGGEPAPIIAARLVTQTLAGCALPPIQLRLATTRGTNALLERKGARTALFITAGFADLLQIGDQQRPDLFALNIIKPPPLNECVVEVHERLDACGKVLVGLDLSQLERDARKLRALGFEVAAVSLMHSYINSVHERMVETALRRMGFKHVSISSELAPLIRLLPRTQTAVVDAYLGLLIEGYLREISSRLHQDSSIHVMTSAGGLEGTLKFRACDSLVSGPAGGVAGAAAVGRLSGQSRIIGFDMGGTSTDVARFDGKFEYRFEQTVGGVRLITPALAIETVAAGGGSICTFVDDRLSVGPESAGADPGPACYGCGGPLTLTDVNLLLGRLDATHFEIPVYADAAHAAADELLSKVPGTISDADRASTMSGLLDIANERVAAAIEQVSLRQGYDPREHAMVAFGGAGGQHACAVAERLGIETIIMPRDASLLSALGLGYSSVERFAQRQVLKPLGECEHLLNAMIDELTAQARQDVAGELSSPAEAFISRSIVHMRLVGQDSTMAIDLDEASRPSIGESLRRSFGQRYLEMYGHVPPTEYEREIEVESIRIIASAKQSEFVQNSRLETATLRTHSPHRTIRAYFGGQWIDAPLFDRNQLAVGSQIIGPALICDRHSTCVIEPNWSAVVDNAGALVVNRSQPVHMSSYSQSEWVQQELFNNRFASIAEEMGQMLQRMAISVNVKERLDFSCAVLNAQGELIVNAPHIPVHLGAIGMCVRAMRDIIVMKAGDVVITNHPAFGGSHLPDITVITPVFFNDQLIGYVANRAHHAEIGGMCPGSMPPTATRLIEEGILIPPQLLVEQGRHRFAEIEKIFMSGPHPSRAAAENIADVRAAVAANHRGAEALRALAEEYGVAEVARQMAAITDRAERLTKAALSQVPQGIHEATELLDDGSPIKVAVRVMGGEAVIDFDGSAATHAGNLNATPAIVQSAVMYVLRLLIGERLPLNEGIMRAIQLNIPRGVLNPDFVNDPGKCPAVVGGNTETSQRVVDALIKALQLAACSQGTMNNVLFGNQRFGYYETICGGSGAGRGFHGADAVHTHMTNTRITDPEIIEHRYPVRIERFAIRRQSGGEGKWNGGDGVIREITFLEPMTLSILTQHRVQKPFGMQGGCAGATGQQRVVRADGEVIELASIDGVNVNSGDRFVIETPGGGGWGNT